jgi:hypothetical protein
MTDELKDFCRNYEVNVLNDSKNVEHVITLHVSLQNHPELILFAMTLWSLKLSRSLP